MSLKEKVSKKIGPEGVGSNRQIGRGKKGVVKYPEEWTSVCVSRETRTGDPGYNGPVVEGCSARWGHHTGNLSRPCRPCHQHRKAVFTGAGGQVFNIPGPGPAE